MRRAIYLNLEALSQFVETKDGHVDFSRLTDLGLRAHITIERSGHYGQTIEQINIEQPDFVISNPFRAFYLPEDFKERTDGASLSFCFHG